jgi:hypothetical protein
MQGRPNPSLGTAPKDTLVLAIGHTGRDAAKQPLGGKRALGRSWHRPSKHGAAHVHDTRSVLAALREFLGRDPPRQIYLWLHCNGHSRPHSLQGFTGFATAKQVVFHDSSMLSVPVFCEERGR